MKAKRYHDGDRTNAICLFYGKLAEQTSMTRGVAFTDGVGVAKAILGIVCDQCDRVIAVPAQSTSVISKARKQ